MQPLSLFRRVAVAEASTWTLLLTGMFLKYVTETTDLGVRIFGMVHGVVFIAYCLVVLLVAVDQGWTRSRAIVGLISSIPPFMTLWFERHVEHRRGVDGSWRLRREQPDGVLESVAVWLLRNPLLGVGVGVVTLAALTGVALVVGPPAG